MGYILDARRSKEELFSWIKYIVEITHDHVDSLDFTYADLVAVEAIKVILHTREQSKNN